MGFDWNLMIELHIDPVSGMPWVWGEKLEKLSYNPEDWRLPERFRQFTVMRGHHLHHYIADIEMGESIFQCEVDTLLYYFPSWELIADKENWGGCDWDEGTHNLLRECLEWCSKKRGFTVSWSY